MKAYCPNYGWGEHSIKITLQAGTYLGKIIKKINGNTKGFKVLESAKEISEDEKNSNNCKLRIQNDWFYCVLKNTKGNELEINDKLDNFDDYIVKVEIVDYKKDKEK